MSASESEVAAASEAPEVADTPVRDVLDVKIELGILVQGSDSKVVQFRMSRQDNAEVVRMYLGDIGEIHCASAYSLEADTGDSTEPVSEFAQLESILTEPEQETLAMKVVLDFYDEKKARDHARKVRDFVKYPYIAPAAIGDHTVDSAEEKKQENGKDGKILEDANTGKDKEKTKEAKYDEIIATEMSLLQFYDEMLYRVGDVDRSTLPQSVLSRLGVNSNVQLPSDCVKGISESGWSPPSPARRMQGDLIYLEVSTASEGVLQITGTAQGFFVNMSSRNHFDPRPSVKKHCFNHSLLECLRMAVPSFDTALCEHFSKPSEHRSVDLRGITRSLSSVATMYAHGRADANASGRELQWNLPPASVTGGKSGPAYDLSRAQMALGGVSEDLISTGVIDPSSAPREWNEDLQASNALPSNTLQEKTIRAKFSHKTFTDFEMVVKAGVVDIAEGKVPAYNPLDAEDSQVYLYQGIFYSAAADQKEGMRLSSGDAASRKTAKQDLANMRRIHEMQVDGLCSVLQVVADYKGTRFIAQTIIPGILNNIEGGGRLMYGSVDAGVRLRVKKDALELMRTVAKELHLGERSVPAMPVEKDKEVAKAEAEQQAKLKEQLGHLVDIPEEAASPLRVDDEDEVNELSSESVTHIGPLESKIILGTDKRMYVLELPRLTPRDANYVPKEQGGTGVLSEEALAKVDADVVQTYVLRHELIEQYLSHKLETAKHEVLTNHLKERKDRFDKLGDEHKARLEALKADNKEESEEETKKRNDEQMSLLGAFQDELSTDMAKITLESVAPSFQINPNVFFPQIVAATDADEVKKDEQVARDLAHFLAEMLKHVTAEIRKGSVAPVANAMMVTLLHGYGVNMRYLGDLAHLARESEAADYVVKTSKKDSTTVYAMPPFWRDMLEVEMVARSVRIVLDSLLKDNKIARQSPATTIASLLSHVLHAGEKLKNKESTGGDDDGGDGGSITTTSSGGNKSEAKDSNGGSGGKSKSKSKNKNKNKKAGGRGPNASSYADDATGNTSSSALGGINSFVPVDAASDAGETIRALDAILCKRFRYSLEEINATCAADASKIPAETEEGKEEKEKKEKDEEEKEGDSGPLGRRLDRTRLLRRICQLAGLRVSTREYNYHSQSTSGGNTFTADDIGDLLPRIKSNAPSHPLPEASNLILRSQQYLKQGDMQSAYFLAQEAQSAVHAVTGPMSTHVITCSENLADIIMYAAGKEDSVTSVLLNARNLDTIVQLHGLDSHQAISVHLKLAELLTAAGEHCEALQHFLSAKYGILLAAGPDHPVFVELLRRVADLCRAGGLLDVNEVYKLLVAARDKAYTYHIKANIGLALGKFLDECNALEQAYSEVTQSHRIMQQLYGEEDAKTEEAKVEMLAVKKKFVKARVDAQKSQQVAMEKQLELRKVEHDKQVIEDVRKTQQSEMAKKRYKQALENARSRAGRR